MTPCVGASTQSGREGYRDAPNDLEFRAARVRAEEVTMDKADLTLQLRIVPIIGPGKVQLLEAIERFGSISGAARSMGMAYPNAWKLIDNLNSHFREPLVRRIIGGKRGGGASLTDNGRIVLSIFRSMQAKAQILLASDLEALSYLLTPADIEAGCPVLDRTMTPTACAADPEAALPVSSVQL